MNAARRPVAASSSTSEQIAHGLGTAIDHRGADLFEALSGVKRIRCRVRRLHIHLAGDVHVTELSPTARGAAASLHSSTFYLGQALGPIYYGFTFKHGEVRLSLAAGALVVFAVGLICAKLLRHPSGGSVH